MKEMVVNILLGLCGFAIVSIFTYIAYLMFGYSWALYACFIPFYIIVELYVKLITDKTLIGRLPFRFKS